MPRKPVLFELGGLEIQSYGVSMALALGGRLGQGRLGLLLAGDGT